MSASLNALDDWAPSRTLALYGRKVQPNLLKLLEETDTDLSDEALRGAGRDGGRG